MLDPDVDGIDASLMLSTNKGLVDIFTDECLLSPLHGTVYNIVEELFGLRHDGQVHVSSLFPNLLNSVVDIPEFSKLGNSEFNFTNNTLVFSLMIILLNG